MTVAATVRHSAALSAVPPFDLAMSLRFLSGFSPCSGEQQISGESVRKAFALEGGALGIAEVSSSRVDGVVRLTVHTGRPVSRHAMDAFSTAVRQWLSLDDDMREFLDIAAADPPMRAVLAATHGLHQVRFASLAEGACYFVLTQRTSQAVAGSRKRKLAQEYGQRIELDSVTYVAFPTLDTLTQLSPADLGRFAANPRQAEYLVHVIAGLDRIGEQFLREAPYDESMRALRSIRGVGEFTASAILLRVLGRTDSVPLEMAQFSELAAVLYGRDTSLDTVRARYGRYVGWWAYLAKAGLSWPRERREVA